MKGGFELPPKKEKKKKLKHQGSLIRQRSGARSRSDLISNSEMSGRFSPTSPGLSPKKFRQSSNGSDSGSGGSKSGGRSYLSSMLE